MPAPRPWNHRENSADRAATDKYSRFAVDFTETPYWQVDLPEIVSDSQPLPAKADVVVIGSGYTGLHAALQTARAGRTTVVVESGSPGHGCSTRNGGQISTSVKPSVEQLAKRFGLARAAAIRKEGEAALEWIEDFVRTESIDCDFVRSGRFHAAHTPAQYEKIARHAELLNRNEGIEAFAVPRSDQRSELGTDVYHGGVVFPRHASLNAGRYHHGLLTKVIEAGVTVVSQCRAKGITRIRKSGELNAGPATHQVQTEKGSINAQDVLIATNGYTGNLTPWLHNRIIPIGSYIIATEPLPTGLIDELFPTGRIASDTCRVVYYYRASPDRTRVLFGGRVSASETDPVISGPRLHADMCRIFPQLHDTRISHSWVGQVAYTFDTMAHTGRHDGLYYALGYCGSGVSMASYLGMRAGQKIVGNPVGQTAFDDLPFPARPLYRGKPWFLPAVVSWYRWRDRVEYTRSDSQVAGAGQRPASGQTVN